MSMVGVLTYQGTDFTLQECMVFLSQFSGGSVDLKLDDNSGIATVCLYHPEKKNSITGKMMVFLEEAISKLETWKIGKGVLIFGAENNFCSGGDLNFAQQTGTAEGGYKMATLMQNVLMRLKQLPMISVAFVEGFALGGGAELAISCDYRLFANDDSVMGFVHTKMGIIPAWGGLTTAVQLLGYRTALDLMITARLVRTREAVTLGLCDAVVGDMSGAMDWLAQHTKSDVSVVRAVKCVAHNIRQGGDQEDILNHEKRVFSPLWGGSCQQTSFESEVET